MSIKQVQFKFDDFMASEAFTRDERCAVMRHQLRTGSWIIKFYNDTRRVITRNDCSEWEFQFDIDQEATQVV